MDMILFVNGKTKRDEPIKEVALFTREEGRPTTSHNSYKYKRGRMFSDVIGWFIIGILLFIFYIPPSLIVYRNTAFKLPLRVVFSATIVPLFFFLC